MKNFTDKKLAIYVHYPFCKSKCPYCDFNSHVVDNVDSIRFINAYEKELEFFARNIEPQKISSIFFGGGTPSLMPVEMVQRILSKINSLWQVDKNCEITLEANPTSFEAKKFEDFKKAGINRLSLGIQALNDDDLKFLGRNHSANEAIKTIRQVQRIFDNFSFDLIYTRPNQKIDNWLRELEQAINFNGRHLSLYQLTIEKGTPFFKDFKERKFDLPNEELAAEFYQKTNDFMAKNGYINYEISNYAKPAFESKHNLSYWQGNDYVGIGAGAHSRVYFKDQKKRQALMMIHNPQNWLQKVEECGIGLQQKTSLDKNEVLEELILTSLRTESGLNNKILAKHNLGEISQIFHEEKLRKLANQGLINFDYDAIKIATNYKILANSIIAKITQANQRPLQINEF